LLLQNRGQRLDDRPKRLPRQSEQRGPLVHDRLSRRKSAHASAPVWRLWRFGGAPSDLDRGLAQAEGETSPETRVELENLASAYLRLAAQAKRNTQLDVTYEPPPPKIDDSEMKR
jgi:hypothetical protein